MAAGCAFFDYDNDGWMDIFILGGRTPRGHSSRLQQPALPQQSRRHIHRRHRKGWLTRRTGWAQGVCVGDYNNDGFEDLFLTYYGQNRLYRNNGDGTFTDVTAKAGLLHPDTRFSTGCTFVDYNRDGHARSLCLELSRDRSGHRAQALARTCPTATTKEWPSIAAREVCPKPHQYLYRNNGDGTFTDVSEGVRQSPRCADRMA